MTSPSDRDVSQEVLSAPERRLLIVDDEEPLRTMMQSFFSSRGFLVTTAASANEALAVLQHDRFLCAIVDIRMPGISGLKMIPQARDIDPDLAILMLTGVNDAPSATEALANGAYDYLVKPVELVDLLNSVEEALHKRELLLHHKSFNRAVHNQARRQSAEIAREHELLTGLMMGLAELIAEVDHQDARKRQRSIALADQAIRLSEQFELPAQILDRLRATRSELVQTRRPRS